MISVTTVSSNSDGAKSLIARCATDDDYALAKQRLSKIVQNNFLLTRAALRALLTRATDSNDWLIRPNAQGKPQAFTSQGIEGPYISLSHTHGLVGCAISKETSVGIDVEFWRPRDFASIADYAFGPQEREEVNHEGISAFYRIWTLREAIAKAAGEGLLASIDGQDHAAGVPPSKCWTSGIWRLFYTSPCAHYSLAVASEDKNMCLNFVSLD